MSIVKETLDNDIGDSLLFMDVIVDFLKIINKSDFAKLFFVKGGIALNGASTLYTYRLLDRSTIDLDVHWLESNKLSWEDFINSVEILLNFNSVYNYTITSRRGFLKNPNGDSLRFRVSYKNTFLEFDMDMNFGENLVRYNLYELDDVIYRAYSIEYMLADKLKVVSSSKLYRRVKDLLDIYYISKFKNYDYLSLINSINEKQDLKNINSVFILGSYDKVQLIHAYDSLKRIINKPSLEQVMSVVINFITPLYCQGVHNMKWDKVNSIWIGGGL